MTRFQQSPEKSIAGGSAATPIKGYHDRKPTPTEYKISNTPNQDLRDNTDESEDNLADFTMQTLNDLDSQSLTYLGSTCISIDHIMSNLIMIKSTEPLGSTSEYKSNVSIVYDHKRQDELQCKFNKNSDENNQPASLVENRTHSSPRRDDITYEEASENYTNMLENSQTGMVVQKQGTVALKF